MAPNPFDQGARYTAKQGGGQPAIIERWKELAQAEPEARRRADYAGLALVFAELADCRPAWQQALEGWNVEQSLQVLEWQAEAEKRGLARGKAEAKAEAKVEALLRVLHKRFPAAASGDLEQVIRATSDLDQLDHWLDAAASASTLAQFRRLAGLEPQNGGRQRRSKTRRSPGRRKRS